MAANKFLTEDELVSTLSHSSLKTLLVEGKDDIAVYRWIEDSCNGMFDVIQCHCRNTLINVYKRRAEFPNAKVVFVADRDTYLYTSVPEEYDGIIFTSGYSIENDLYHGRGIENILNSTEKSRYASSMQEFVRYYACQIEKFLAGTEYNLRQMPCALLDTSDKLMPEKVEFGFSEPSKEWFDKIYKEYDHYLRGHSLFSVLFRLLSERKDSPKYSHVQLYEICYKTMKSEKMVELESQIMAAFTT